MIWSYLCLFSKYKSFNNYLIASTYENAFTLLSDGEFLYVNDMGWFCVFLFIHRTQDNECGANRALVSQGETVSGVLCYEEW